jgi:hypothetical protein
MFKKRLPSRDNRLPEYRATSNSNQNRKYKELEKAQKFENFNPKIKISEF